MIGCAAFVARQRAVRCEQLRELASELPESHLYYRVWVSGRGAKSAHDHAVLDDARSFRELARVIVAQRI